MNLKLPTGAGALAGKKSLKFPVAGIGASAGGLTALEQFFGNMPERPGMAFIVIQHLDPNYKGMMPDLIRKVTKMEVIQASDNQKVRQNTVYVLPPGKNMSILNGKLHLFDLVQIHGLRLPIDFFFHSLADDSGENSIGIILSGMGSDGTLGLQSIKARSGLTMVQEPATAEYDSMPINAIKSVQIDVVAPAGELPGKLISFLKRTFPPFNNVSTDIKDKSSLEKIVLLIRSKTGHDLSQYKKSTVYRRVERRMMVHKIHHIRDYIKHLVANPEETEILFKEMLIGTTSFFRDPELWQFLTNEIFPDLIKSKSDGSPLRIWIPGCSTGEEAFSYAIALREVMDTINPGIRIPVSIFATDLDSDAIEQARRGVYKEGIASTVSGERLQRFFTISGNYYKINPDIREMVVFAVQNVISDPPFTKVDLISCRNLLIYQEPDLQHLLISVFHYSLGIEGFLILGTSETIGTHSVLFETVNSRLRVFRKISFAKSNITDFRTSTMKSEHPAYQINTPMKSFENIQTSTDKLILQQYSPAGIIVNSEGEIIYLTRRSGNYLELAAGKASMNIFSLLKEAFTVEFPIAFRRAAASSEKVMLKNLKIEIGNDIQLVDIIIQKLEKPVPLKGFILIVFRDSISIPYTPVPGRAENTDNLKSEIELEHQRLRDELQNTIEAMQVSEEELKSANEEMQSTNEELQSTNEELTTSKEELQSMNEELQTINLELMNKVDEYTAVSNDLKNLLESTEIAILFLTKDFRVRRFTSAVTKIFNLIDNDLGRPLRDLALDLIYEDFQKDMKEVLRTLVSCQKQIHSKSGIWYQVRIMPYRTVDDKIDGLVITFSDITIAKNLEAELNRTITDLNVK